MLYHNVEIDLVDCPDGFEKKFLNYTLKCKNCSKICIPPYRMENGDSCCKECAGDKKANLTIISFSHFEEKEILQNIHINCLFNKRGCSARYNYLDSLTKYNEHIKSCSFTPVKCEVCMFVYNHSDFILHKEICKFEQCQKCQNKKMLNEDHDCISSLSKYFINKIVI